MTLFGVQLDRLEIFFWIATIFLSIFLMVNNNYDIAWKLYAILALITISTILIFCLIVAKQFAN